MLGRTLHSNREMFYFIAIAAAILLGVYWYSELYVIEQDSFIDQTQVSAPLP
jgi:hypothetical protein